MKDPEGRVHEVAGGEATPLTGSRRIQAGPPLDFLVSLYQNGELWAQQG